MVQAVILAAVLALAAGVVGTHVLRKPLRRMRVKRLVRKDQEAAGPRVPTAFPDGAPAPEAEEVSMEKLEERVHWGQWDSEKNLCDKLLAEEVGALAMAKLLLQLHPAGGIKDSEGSIKKNIRQHAGRIEVLKKWRYYLEHSGEESLPMPSDLEVVRATNGADAG